jgi:hypothetical protein
VIFFSATWFTSLSHSRTPKGLQPHTRIVRLWDLGAVCRASRERG